MTDAERFIHRLLAEKRRAKLEALDEWAPVAVRWLIDWLRFEPELIIAAAKGRHAEGAIRYGDTLMYEYTDPELEAEALQELADAVNYIALRLSRNG